ncbi:conserved oligomeric Golgi complex subunit 3 [[Candida] railenensis]|uniref:Conserved oligomeric Golgi complex subunit 3 n=1 Tax=[Candida] railenensis TaxID=45579 RepID=A0A9P0QL03_9ASCO|nr:conserved oligomeric Golgi complex subunit 3 [[Candida] railenensis]
MTRGRSKSIVQKIASDVATHDDKLDELTKDNLEQKQKAANTTYRASSTDSHTRIRSKTTSQVHNSESHIAFSTQSYSSTSSSPSPSPCSSIFDAYPLTQKEYTALSSSYINSNNREIIIPNESIQTIQSLSNDSVLSFQSICKSNLSAVSSLISQTNDIITHLNDLTFKYDYVTRETSDFASKSQALIDKKSTLEEISSELQNNLEIFESFDSITKVLTNTPGINVVKKQSFHQTLFKLDNCLYFISQHENYKEATTYKVRFRQCMTRALTLIRNYLIEDLKLLQKDISSRLVKSLSEKDQIATFSFDLFLYTSFNNHIENGETSNSNQFQDYYNFPNLGFEIYKRINDHPEYLGLYNDCLNQYFKVRSGLLNDYIWNQIDTSLEEKEKNEHQNLVQFTQNNLSFFKKILYKELDLFQKYFVQDALNGNRNTVVGGSVYMELIEWFKSLLEPLYDTLRNKIIREINIGVLCEITTLLQKYYEFEDDNQNSWSGGVINFGELFEPILQDVQARLIFRIQLYIDEKLLKYKAKPEDLNVGNRRRGASLTESSSVSPSKSAVDTSSLNYEFQENHFPAWFLPVGKALTILSSIYQLINSIVFDDLAHYIVHSCIFILKGSAYKLAILHLGELDAKLYLLKNLILLQQQLNTFDIQYVRTETSLDFTSGILNIINNSKARGGGVIEMIKTSVPKVINNMIDAKFEIETELTNTFTEFIKDCVEKVSEPLTSEGNALQASLAFRDKISLEFPKLHHEMRVYLGDDNTNMANDIIISQLMDAIVSQLITKYETWYNGIDTTGDNKSEISEIMEVDTLYGFLSEIVNELGETDDKLIGPVAVSEDD